MTSVEQFDILVLGGGKGGKSLAMDQAKAGRRVALIEDRMIGGSCINIACIPTKTLVRSAERAAFVEDAEIFGIDIVGASVDMKRVARRTADVVEEMVEFNRHAIAASGLDFVMGWGRFVEPRVIEVAVRHGVRRLTGAEIYLDLGTTALLPQINGLADAEPMTHVELLKLDELPGRLVILGGGYIGMEMAQAFSRLGSEVVLLEAGSRLAFREDDDIAVAIAEILTGDGIEIVPDARVVRVRGASGKDVSVETQDGRTFSGSHLLVAAGRRPRTSNIGLDVAGVSLTDRGFIVVDERLRTTAPGISALGEVAGTPMFTHASFDDFRVAKAQLAEGGRTTTGRLIPSCMFIDPEFARVGMSESDAMRAGIDYRLAKLSMDVVPRARTMNARKGFMKCLISAADDQILGFSMLGERAGEVMTAVQFAMLGNVPYTILRDAIIAHPTIAEALNMLLPSVPPIKR